MTQSGLKLRIMYAYHFSLQWHLLMECYYCSISLSPNGWTDDFLCLK
jgi:hypothetical protein